MARTEVPGIEDVARLARWLRDNDVPAPGGAPDVELIAGGRSNLTYRLRFRPPGAEDARPSSGGEDAGPSSGGGNAAPPSARGAPGPPSRGDSWPALVLRRPPLGHVLPTAHDMSREYRVLRALHGTAVPVPRPLALCPDPDVIGAPFYVMEHVDGLVLRSREDGSLLTTAQAREVSTQFADMLATIHAIDPSAVGLEGFGRPAGYLARQIARWQRQWELSATRDLPGYERLVERLTVGLPGDTGGEAAGTLVHGDFRLDNMLIGMSAGPRIAAVVDWEMSTLGDPLADLGLALVYWAEHGEEDDPAYRVGAAATTAPGFATRAQVADRYQARTGRDLSELRYYMAFGCFKLAVVLEGIHARYLQRKTVGAGFEREGEAVPELIRRAHRLLDSGDRPPPSTLV